MDTHHLIQPVAKRAIADQLPDFRFFSDRFARDVLERLDVSTPQLLPSIAIQNDIALCHWIDTLTRNFVVLHPKAEIVEIEGGLSTRFYRVSERSDWPQFSWVAINNTKDDGHIDSIFPETENFSRQVCERPTECWYNHISLSDKKECLLIVGENTPLETRVDVLETLAGIACVAIKTGVTVNIVVCHSVKRIDTLLKYVPAEVIIKEVFSRCPSILKSVFSPSKRQNTVGKYAHYCRISPYQK